MWSIEEIMGYFPNHLYSDGNLLTSRQVAPSKARKPLVLGLCGFSGSGKDTVADYLVNHYHFVKIGVADVMKDMLSMVYDLPRGVWDIEQWRSHPHPLFKGRTPRMVMQEWGTNVCRRYDPDIWLPSLRKTIEINLLKGHSVVVKDVRFYNELDVLKCHNGTFVYVDRPNLVPDWVCCMVKHLGVNALTTNIVRLVSSKYAHESELTTVLLRDDADHTINNHNSISELTEQIDILLKELQNDTY